MILIGHINPSTLEPQISGIEDNSNLTIKNQVITIKKDDKQLIIPLSSVKHISVSLDADSSEKAIRTIKKIMNMEE